MHIGCRTLGNKPVYTLQSDKLQDFIDKDIATSVFAAQLYLHASFQQLANLNACNSIENKVSSGVNFHWVDFKQDEFEDEVPQPRLILSMPKLFR